MSSFIKRVSNKSIDFTYILGYFANVSLKFIINVLCNKKHFNYAKHIGPLQ